MGLKSTNPKLVGPDLRMVCGKFDIGISWHYKVSRSAGQNLIISCLVGPKLWVHVFMDNHGHGRFLSQHRRRRCLQPVTGFVPQDMNACGLLAG